MSAFSIQATISAIDATGPAINSVKKRIRSLQKVSKDLQKVTSGGGAGPASAAIAKNYKQAASALRVLNAAQVKTATSTKTASTAQTKSAKAANAMVASIQSQNGALRQSIVYTNKARTATQKASRVTRAAQKVANANSNSSPWSAPGGGGGGGRNRVRNAANSGGGGSGGGGGGRGSARWKANQGGGHGPLLPTVPSIVRHGLRTGATNTVHEAAAGGYNAVKADTNQRTQMENEGINFDSVEGQKVTAAAQKITRDVPQLSLDEAYASIRDSYAVVGDWAHAAEAATKGAKRTSVLKTSMPGLVEPNRDMTKATESLMGSQMLTEAGRDMAQRLQDNLAKALIEQKGQVLPRDLLGIANMSKGSLRANSKDMATPESQQAYIDKITKAAILSAETKGAAFGNALNMTQRALDGQMTGTAKGAMEKLGLLDPSKVKTRDTDHNPKKLAYGAMNPTGLDSMSYLTDKLVPALAGMDPQKRDWTINQIASNRTVAGAIKMMVSEQTRLNKSMENIDRMKSIPGMYDNNTNKDVGAGAAGMEGAAKTALETAMKPFTESIVAVMNTATKTMQAVTTGLTQEENDPHKKLKDSVLPGLAVTGIAAAIIAKIAGSIENDPSSALQTAALAGIAAKMTGIVSPFITLAKFASPLGVAAIAVQGIFATIAAAQDKLREHGVGEGPQTPEEMEKAKKLDDEDRTKALKEHLNRLTGGRLRKPIPDKMDLFDKPGTPAIPAPTPMPPTPEASAAFSAITQAGTSVRDSIAKVATDINGDPIKGALESTASGINGGKSGVVGAIDSLAASIRTAGASLASAGQAAVKAVNRANPANSPGMEAP